MLRVGNIFNTVQNRKSFKVYYFKVIQLVCTQHEHHMLYDKHQNNIPLLATLKSFDLWILTSQLQQFDFSNLQE